MTIFGSSKGKNNHCGLIFYSMRGHCKPDHSKLGNYSKVETITMTPSSPTPSLAMTLTLMLATTTRKNKERLLNE